MTTTTARTSPDDDLQFALTLADIADGLTMAGYRSADLVVHTKPDLTPVTDVDRGVERALAEVIAAHLPGDGIVGEEYGTTSQSAGDGASAQPGRHWIIDPIDGTKNFVRGVPVWATLIALSVGSVDDADALTIGVVSAPALQRRWWAAPHIGAFTRGPEDSAPRPIQVSGVSDLVDASMSISDSVGWPAGVLSRLESQVWRMRGYGDFWSHMLVAEGAVDIAAEPELSLWDIAALVPIVRAAGGRISSFSGGTRLDSAVTTNGHLHDPVLELLT